MLFKTIYSWMTDFTSSAARQLGLGHSVRRRSSRPKPAAERLELRVVPAISMSLQAGVLQIQGDNGLNQVVIDGNDFPGDLVDVTVVSRATATSRPVTVHQSFLPSQILFVEFHGGNGNDSFINHVEALPTLLYGDAGNDSLTGGDNIDFISGGAGNDTILGRAGDDTLNGNVGNDSMRGGGGDDDLYGDTGNDILFGEQGDDGVTGGDAGDSLYGNQGDDRFLVRKGQPSAKDASTNDAVITFSTGDKQWTVLEMKQVDQGLRLLHHETGNDNLLELRNGVAVELVRHGTNEDLLGSNNSRGTIRLYEGAFKNEPLLAQTVIHEFAHNWDSSAELGNWSDWVDLSCWNQDWSSLLDPAYALAENFDFLDPWFYHANVGFALTYGRTNPQEDFATGWESYFQRKYQMANPQGLIRLPADKQDFLQDFFQDLR
ncbi:MAG: calcium-binding protein [Planctomycetaceae bacterium]